MTKQYVAPVLTRAQARLIKALLEDSLRLQRSRLGKLQVLSYELAIESINAVLEDK
jgi:hypothetical protein